ncbi:MAG: hypothetical protein QXL94_00900 [Candidatus Parvarchaeum sp.]
MAKSKKSKKSDELEMYIKAFRVKHGKHLDMAYKKLAGHEKLKTPTLDAALKKLSGHEKRNTPSLDRAYAYLAGTKKRMKA